MSPISTLTQAVTLPSSSTKMLIDCRAFNFTGSDAANTAESVVAWVMSFPQPKAMHVVLPSSAPQVRRLQCTLQGMGCSVSRVTKCQVARF